MKIFPFTLLFFLFLGLFSFAQQEATTADCRKILVYPDRIAVPAYFYKVILDYTEPEIKGIGFIIPNEGSLKPLQHFAVAIDSVEKVTGTDFFYQLPDDQEKVIESTVDHAKWSWTATTIKGR